MEDILGQEVIARSCMTKSRELLEMLESFELHHVDELMPQKTVSFEGGQRKTKYKCPQGYKFDPDTKTCRRMSIFEIRDHERSNNQGADTMRGRRSGSIIQRAITMMKRKNQIGTSGFTGPTSGKRT